MAMDAQHRVVLWFRNDLRIADNVLLNNEVTLNASSVMPVFVFDDRHYGDQRWHDRAKLPTDVGLLKCGSMRAQFNIESVYNLKANLQKLGSDLHIFQGETERIFERICDENTVVLAQEEIGPEETRLVARVKRRIKGCLSMLWGGTLCHINDIPESCTSGVSGPFTKFRKSVESDFNVRPLFPVPERLPETEDLSAIEGYMSEPVTLETLHLKPYKFDKRSDLVFKGGEDAAADRLNGWIKKALATYKQTRNGLQGANYSSHFSPWLANGCMSAKQIYYAVTEFENNNGGQTRDTYWLIFELLWRDYFRYVLNTHGGALFRPYGPFNRSNNKWKTNDAHFLAWINGTTGVPFLDANMRQLKATGWMSNRGRQNAASFLIWELGLDWRLGAAWFEQQLLDHDVASNCGNWVSAANLLGGRRNRFNLVKQAKDYDPNCEFILTWVPELRTVPKPYVSEPWKMNHREQITAGCVLGKDYPKSLVSNSSRHYRRK
jgi:deoxyribodipyrimidine photo-lyase